jgi:hypothetical protein
MNATVLSVHAPLAQCRLRAGSTSDGDGTPRSVSFRAVLAMLRPVKRWANIPLHVRRCLRIWIQPL